MKLAKFKAVKASLKVSYGIERCTIIEKKDKSTKYRLEIYNKDKCTFHNTNIIAICESLGLASYITYDEELNRCVLHIF